MFEEIKRRNKQKKLDDFTEYDFISPCSCNIKAHRECLKSMVIEKKMTKCQRCDRYYTIDHIKKREKSPGSKRNSMTFIFFLLYVSAILGLVFGIIEVIDASKA